VSHDSIRNFYEPVIDCVDGQEFIDPSMTLAVPEDSTRVN
jgi:hypothetical protein